MIERDTSRSIDDAAAAWVARQDRAPLSPDEEAAFRVWLDGDPRCAGAFLRARAVSMRSESARALGDGYDPADFGGRRRIAPPSRREAFAWAGGATVCIGAGVAAGMALQAPTAHATERGEVRLVPLADGSTVMLNTETLVKVKYDDARRLVRLVEGEADFTVLPEPRPFVVEVGERRLAIAEGGVRVRRLEDSPVDILVHHGRVEVASRRRGGARPVLLTDNTRLVVPATAPRIEAAPAPQAVPVDVVTRELAWREGRIAFEGETLAEAAAAFARYSDKRIVVEDSRLAREPVTGLFAANDPTGFARAAASIFGASVEVRGGAVILSSGKPAQ